MQTGIRFEKISRPSTHRTAAPETLRIVRQRTTAQVVRRQARRVANILKGRS